MVKKKASSGSKLSASESATDVVDSAATSGKEIEETKKGGFHFSRTELGLLPFMRYVILTMVCLLAFCVRLFAVVRFESIIHEFDPWFNYRGSKYLVENGWYNFINWFDHTAWYPLGRIVGGTVYPGLMITSGFAHWLLHSLSLPVHIREICVFTSPVFSAFTVITTYMYGTSVKDRKTGLMAAVFISVAPGYIARSVAGSYDNEGIAIFAMMLCFYLWTQSVEHGSMAYALATAVVYWYMVSAWGGYVYIINLIPLHAFTLLLMGRYSDRLYISYCSFYTLATLMSMTIPFVGFQPVKTSEHMAAAGVFCLLQAVAFLFYLRKLVHNDAQFRQVFIAGLILASMAIFLAVVGLTYSGVIQNWGGRFYSMFDTSYARKNIPIIASVSEHQPTTWSHMFGDLHIALFVFPFGVFLCFQELTDVRVFHLIYCGTAIYFAGVMVRLMLTLTPAVCVSAALAISTLLEVFFERVPVDGEESKERPQDLLMDNGRVDVDEAVKAVTRKKRTNVSLPVALGAAVLIGVLLFQFSYHSIWMTSRQYSNPSVILASNRPDGSRVIIDDFREAYWWLRTNTPEDTRIFSWWDYGYQIAGMSNRTVLVDNNTWNNTHISLVGKALASTEEEAFKIIDELDVDYMLMLFGGALGFAGDDINKFLWIIRIAEGENPGVINEQDFYNQGQYRVDVPSETFKNSLMYKLCFYGFNESRFQGRDRVRNAKIPDEPITLTYFEEAYTTEHWMVRLYRVKREHCD
eukprot:Clim_evm98s88 gene=Clim_evmTU98s88